MTRLKWYSLRVRLLVLLLFAILPAFALLLYMGESQRRSALHRAEGEAMVLARTMASRGDGPQYFLSGLATMPQVRSRSESCQALFVSLVGMDPRVRRLSATGPDGMRFADSGPTPKRVNDARTPWFRTAVATHQVVTAIEPAVGTEPARLVWACPVTDAKGNLLAVLSMSRRLPWFDGTTENESVRPGTVALLVDRSGTLIHADPPRLGSIGRPPPMPHLRSIAASGGEATWSEAGPDGVQRIWAMAPTTKTPRATWMVAVSFPRAAVLAPVWRSFSNYLAILALFSAAALLIAWRGVKAVVVRRVEALVGASRRLARGDSSARSGLKYGRGELSELSRSFDQMAGALERRDADRRRAEEALRQSEQRFRTVTDRGSDLVTMSTRDGVRLYVSGSVTRVLGYEPTELLWNNVFELVHPDDVELVRAQVREQIVSPGKSVPIVYRIRHKDGRWRWLEGTGTNMLEDPAVRANVASYRDVTERVVAEEQLRESEKRFRAIFDSALDALVVTDTSGTFVEANPSACELFGITRNRLLGHRVADFCVSGDEFAREWGEFLRRGRVKSHWQLTLPGQGVRDIEYSGNTDFASEHHLLVLRDVTERNRAAQALTERERHFRALIERSADGIWLLAADRRVTYASPSLERLLGYTQSEFVGHDLLGFVHPEDQDRCRRRFAALTDTPGNETGVELRLRHEDRSWRWIECVGTNLLDEASVQAVVVNARDITEWVDAQQELRDSEERFRQMAEHVPQVFWTFDLDAGRVRYVSPAYEEIWGRTCESLRDDPDSFLEGVHPDDRDAAASSWRSMREQRRLPELEFRIIRPDGTMRWIWNRGFPVRDEKGRAVRMTGIAEDITGRKQTEQALRTMSLVDELTGLYNRRGFLTFADQQIRIADRTRNAIWLLFTDVDDLKWINDTFGHAEGDRVLVEVSRILRDTFRESDVIARIGGDEFVLIAVEPTRRGVERLAARLESRLEARNRRGHQAYRISLSIGVAYFDPEKPESVEDLITRGDGLMYEQKRARRAS